MAKKITTEHYAQALYEVTKDVSEIRTKEIVAEFVKLLVRSHKLFEVEKIVAQFLKIEQQAAGSYAVEIITSHPLNISSKKMINKILGSNIVMKEKIDPEVLGGIIIKTQDTILDGSVKTQLLKLKQALVK